jgi:hypothetical protein
VSHYVLNDSDMTPRKFISRARREREETRFFARGDSVKGRRWEGARAWVGACCVCVCVLVMGCGRTGDESSVKNLSSSFGVVRVGRFERGSSREEGGREAGTTCLRWRSPRSAHLGRTGRFSSST